MFSLSIEQIIKIMSMPKIGRKTAYKLINEINYNISDDRDLLDFLNEKGKSYRLPFYSQDDFNSAIIDAERILTDSEKQGIKMLSYKDDNYPVLLKKSNDYPIILNYKGNINLLNEMPTVAIIGTREPTEWGMKFGIRLSEVFAEQKFNVVSGLAKGCDAAGHRGALNVKGITTAVLAHGLDKVYPKENKPLAAEILENGGLLVSEYFVGQGALSNFFVERDRIQAGLSLGTIVIETDVKGGTMHTVGFTLDNGRILSAVNHPENLKKEPKTQGNQLLIRERKARPVFDKSEVDKLMLDLSSRFNELNIQCEGSYSISTKIKPIADVDLTIKLNETESNNDLELTKEKKTKGRKSKNKPPQPGLWD
ncbi:DNA-processing protein DprA [Chitinophaga sancti]|uniref:DNA processing protein n=1 Tax=Chitinophaga sancti TaxID=1004 RepID=A0A1K1SI64_9BACT|nr:DNA-processing protein DprA [Chitinophaga sancti]WQD61778.1 DNA-processing protein DprA [Chitinophaga sancti]WQG92653.1 DNA-processing protein DprA [Chitinophaga sancti]SFW84041.1 DNA processing protein [Chitinophaga sancti]